MVITMTTKVALRDVNIRKKMATHFSANQYENAFAANRLQNYQVPNDFKEHPTARSGCTKIVTNDRGHLFPDVPRSKQSPWGNFKGTWDDELDFRKKRQSKQTIKEQDYQNKVEVVVNDKEDKIVYAE